jgi:hypothetical protein
MVRRSQRNPARSGPQQRRTRPSRRQTGGFRTLRRPRADPNAGRKIKRQLIADHAGDAQVVVLRTRRAARRYLAGVDAPESAAAQAIAAGEERS